MATALAALRGRLRSAAARLRRDEGGIAIVEFAMLLPMLLAMCFGVLVLSDAFAVKRKVAMTTRTITDLTTQYAVLTKSQLATLLSASASIIAPYDDTPLGIVVTRVDIDAGGVGKVVWSQAYKTGTALAAGTVVVLPTAMVSANSSIIMGQVTYLYAPLTKVNFMGSVTMSDRLYLNPRISNNIMLTN